MVVVAWSFALSLYYILRAYVVLGSTLRNETLIPLGSGASTRYFVGWKVRYNSLTSAKDVFNVPFPALCSL